MSVEKKVTDEEIAKQLAMSAYHYPPQENEQGFKNACNLIYQALSQKSLEIASLKAEVEKYKKAESDLDAQISIQAGDPFTKEDGYMAGLLNGMLLARANIRGKYAPISYKDKKQASLKAHLSVAVEALNRAKETIQAPFETALQAIAYNDLSEALKALEDKG